MDKPTKRRGIRMTVVFLALALVLPTSVTLPVGAGDQPPKGAAEPAKLAKELIGTWVLVGTPDKVADPPKSGGRLKFITGKHWVITQADPETGKVIFHHGGTYTLDGDTYAETIEYANENTAELIKKTFKFKAKVEGDTYTQVAVGADNPFTEVWKRAK
jgi:hypothetical protein